MSFTIENILTIENIKGLRLIAGGTGLKRQVKWVTILEVLDELAYLDEGDLLVTTGYGLAEDEKLQNNLIQLLAEKGLAGIAIQPGFSLTEIPPTLVSEANRVGFPILYLPKDLSFSKLTRHILKHLINHQFYLLEYSQKIYNQLTKLVLNNQGLDSIATSLVAMIERPVLVLDLFYNPIAEAFPESNQPESWASLSDIISRITSIISVKPQIISLPNDRTVSLVPITTGSEVLGYLCILNTKDPMEEMDSIALEHAATLAALIMLKDIAVRETKNSLKEDFLEETLKGSNSPQILAKKAAAFGYDKNKGYHLILFDLSNWDLFFNLQQETEMYKLKNYLLSSIEHCISKYGLRYMYKFSQEKILLLLQVKSQKELPDVQKVIQEIISIIKNRYADVSIVAGISNYYSKLENLSLAYQEATRALELAKIHNKPITLFSDIEVYNLFYEISKNSFSQSFYKEKLGVLIEYDSKNNSQLLTTLEHFLNCNGNSQETSTSLFVHRHTLRYRLQRIKEITGLDPLASEDRLKLQIALMLAKVL